MILLIFDWLSMLAEGLTILRDGLFLLIGGLIILTCELTMFIALGIWLLEGLGKITGFGNDNYDLGFNINSTDCLFVNKIVSLAEISFWVYLRSYYCS